MNDYVIISYSEWLNWINTHKIYRINQFCHEINNYNNFAFAMYKSLHGKYYDDSAFIIAKLLPTWQINNHKSLLIGYNHLNCLDLAAVDEFYPISQRGAILLRSEAERLGVVFGEPIFEAFWNDWLLARSAERSDWRGGELAQLLVDSPVDLSLVPEEIRPYLLLDQPFPRSEIWSDLEGGPFNAWARASSVLDWYLGQDGGGLPEAFHEEFVVVAAPLKDNFNYSQPLLLETTILDLIANYLQDNINLYLQIALIINYTLKFYDEINVSFSIFEQDLVILQQDRNKSLAANVAYFVGARLDDGVISDLIRSRQPKRFAVLARNRP